MLLGNSLRQTVHTHRASVHQAAKLVAALLRVARVTVDLVESNCSLPPGLWLTSPAGWLPRSGISSGTLRSVIEYGLLLLFFTVLQVKVVLLWVWIMMFSAFIYSCIHAFSALTLLIGHHEERPAYKNWVMRCCCVFFVWTEVQTFAYGPPDATASQNPIISCFS